MKTQSHISCFTPIAEIRTGMINQFYALTKEISKGHWAFQHSPLDKDCVGMKVTDVGSNQSSFKKEIFFELNPETGLIKATFSIDVNNQKALWLHRATDGTCRFEIVLKNFSEETISGLTALVNDYFKIGFEALSSLYSFEEKKAAA